MNKSTRKVLFAFVGMLSIAALILVVYYLLAQGKINFSQKSKPSSTEVEKLLQKDLDTKYPETPTEVVKLYWRYNKCIYNNPLKEEEFNGLLKQLRKLYDQEFLDLEENSEEKMAENLKKDQSEYQKEEKAIATYVVQQNSTVQYGKVDGRDCATVISGTLTKKKSEREQTYEKFLCRLDDEGNWKILGWELTTDAEEISLLGD